MTVEVLDFAGRPNHEALLPQLRDLLRAAGVSTDVELVRIEDTDVAERERALASPGRLRLLTDLVDRERTVEQLAVVAELSVSATSHHLRLLRSLRLVRARRSGRNVFYSLHEHHIADLPAAVRHHHEHVHPLAAVEMPETRQAPA